MDMQTGICRHDLALVVYNRSKIVKKSKWTCKHAAKQTWTCRHAFTDMQTWICRHAWDLWVMTGTSKIVKRQVDLDMLTQTCRHADMNMQAWTPCRDAAMETWTYRRGHASKMQLSKPGHAEMHTDMQTCS